MGIVGFVNLYLSYEFMWGIGDVVNVLVLVGFVIECLNEYLYVNGWKGFDGMCELEGCWMVLFEGMLCLLLMYVIVV